MAQKIARAIARPLSNKADAMIGFARIAIVTGSALALIMAGPALPL